MDSREESELFAICSNLGDYEYDEKGFKHFIPGEDVLANVQDLLRYVRSDDELWIVRLKIGELNVLNAYLVPLIAQLELPRDYSKLFNLLKLVVKLTIEAPAESDNLVEINDCRSLFKQAFFNVGVWEILTLALGTSLEILIGNVDDDDIPDVMPKTNPEDIFELTMLLIHQVLYIKDLNPMDHDKLLTAMQKSNMLDILVVVSINITKERRNRFRDNNARILEIIRGVLLHQKPSVVKVEEVRTVRKTESQLNKGPNKENSGTTNAPETQDNKFDIYKMYELNKPKLDLHAQRHGRLTGTYQRVGSSGKTNIIHGGLKALREGTLSDHKQERKQARALDTISNTRESSRLVRLFLKEFIKNFIESSFNVVMESVWQSIRKQEVHITEKDQLNYVWAICFFLNAYRILDYKNIKKKNFQAGYVTGVLDVDNTKHCITVLKLIDEQMKLKKGEVDPGVWGKKQVLCIQALKEIFVYIEQMKFYTTPDKKNRIDFAAAADSLALNIIYHEETLDAIFQLVRTVKNNVHSDFYRQELIQCIHMVFRVLESYGKESGFVQNRKSRKRKKKAVIEDDRVVPDQTPREENEGSADEGRERTAEMKERAVELKQFYTKFAHPSIVTLYMDLLSNFNTNGPRMNHVIISMFHRIIKEAELPALFYTINTFRILREILCVRENAKNPNNKEIIEFATFIIRKFFDAAAEKPYLYAEALFVHSKGRSLNVFEDEPEEKFLNPRRKWTPEDDKKLTEIYNSYDKYDPDYLMNTAEQLQRTEVQIKNRMKKINLQYRGPPDDRYDYMEDKSDCSESWDESKDVLLRQAFEEAIQNPELDSREKRVGAISTKLELEKRETEKRLMFLGLLCRMKRRKKKKKTKKTQPKKKKPKKNPGFSSSFISGNWELKSVGKAVVEFKESTMLEDDFENVLGWIRDELRDYAMLIDTYEPEARIFCDVQTDQKEAMRNEHFIAILNALKLQPPDENFTEWHIPAEWGAERMYGCANLIKFQSENPGEKTIGALKQFLNTLKEDEGISDKSEDENENDKDENGEEPFVYEDEYKNYLENSEEDMEEGDGEESDYLEGIREITNRNRGRKRGKKRQKGRTVGSSRRKGGGAGKANAYVESEDDDDYFEDTSECEEDWDADKIKLLKEIFLRIENDPTNNTRKKKMAEVVKVLGFENARETEKHLMHLNLLSKMRKIKINSVTTDKHIDIPVDYDFVIKNWNVETIIELFSSIKDSSSLKALKWLRKEIQDYIPLINSYIPQDRVFTPDDEDMIASFENVDFVAYLEALKLRNPDDEIEDWALQLEWGVEEMASCAKLIEYCIEKQDEEMTTGLLSLYVLESSMGSSKPTRIQEDEYEYKDEFSKIKPNREDNEQILSDTSDGDDGDDDVFNALIERRSGPSKRKSKGVTTTRKKRKSHGPVSDEDEDTQQRGRKKRRAPKPKQNRKKRNTEKSDEEVEVAAPEKQYKSKEFISDSSDDENDDDNNSNNNNNNNIGNDNDNDNDNDDNDNNDNDNDNDNNDNDKNKNNDNLVDSDGEIEVDEVQLKLKKKQNKKNEHTSDSEIESDDYTTATTSKPKILKTKNKTLHVNSDNVSESENDDSSDNDDNNKLTKTNNTSNNDKDNKNATTNRLKTKTRTYNVDSDSLSDDNSESEKGDNSDNDDNKKPAKTKNTSNNDNNKENKNSTTSKRLKTKNKTHHVDSDRESEKDDSNNDDNNKLTKINNTSNNDNNNKEIKNATTKRLKTKNKTHNVDSDSPSDDNSESEKGDNSDNSDNDNNKLVKTKNTLNNDNNKENKNATTSKRLKTKHKTHVVSDSESEKDESSDNDDNKLTKTNASNNDSNNKEIKNATTSKRLKTKNKTRNVDSDSLSDHNSESEKDDSSDNDG